MDVESIYTTLKNIISKENIVEVSFVPTPGEDNYKPFLFIENCLGIPFPIVPKTLEYLKKTFVALRKNIELNYKELDYCTQSILLINGEYITAWNERKKLMQLGYIKPKYDLELTKLCLTKHPKSSNLWYHRQWILKNYKDLIQFKNEYDIIEKAINRYATNYFAWNHKNWLLDYMNKTELKEEFKAMENKIYKFISDHAGWNHLFVILRNIIISLSKEEKDEDKKELETLIQEHRLLVRKYMKEFPSHETIWYYLRLLTGLIDQYKQQIYTDVDKDLQSFYDNEITFLQEEYLNENNPNTLLVEEKYALQYKLWLSLIFNNQKRKEDDSNLIMEIKSYQCMTEDTSIDYLMDIINNNKKK
jgi:hypothetical protein